MTIRKTFTPSLASALPPAARGLVVSAMLASLAGCGMLNSVIESDKVDYKAAKKATPLEVPPDLTQLERDNRYAVPDGKGVATASGFQQQKASPTAATPTGATVGPVNTDQVRIERAGSQRWLVVKQTPEQLWPQLKEFWHDNGFTIETESAVTGVMETNWAENRAKIPQDFIRNTVGKVFDSLYSTGTRDRFRTRLERNADGSTDIFISHRGAEEVLTGPQKEVPTWTVRPNDPGLEAQFLARFMARVSGTPEVKTAVAAVNGAPAATPHAKLVGAGAAATVELDEGFDRAWRRVGLALDRVGFTVEDRDRVQGVYFVRYVDPDAKAPSFLSKLLSLGSNSDKEKEAQRYKVLVKSAAESSTTQVTVQSNDGKTDPGATGARILSVLNDELK